MRQGRYDSPVVAAMSGVLNAFRRSAPIGELREEDRIDGRTCLVTGANRGLGRAIAAGLLRRGGRVVAACRGGGGQLQADLAREGGGGSGADVRVEPVDLADIESIHGFCERMKRAGECFDVSVLNAGVVPSGARRTKQGFEEMFAVNYLANFALVERLLADGTIPRRSSGPPRVVFVSSEAHRSAGSPDFDRIGRFEPYGMSGSMREYSRSKLLLAMYASELSRRLSVEGVSDVSVHSLCPGAVSTGIAREAPAWSRPLLKLVFALFFKSPRRAAVPALYLCCSPEVEGRTGIYLHMMTPKEVSPEAMDPAAGRRLREVSEQLLREGPRS